MCVWQLEHVVLQCVFRLLLLCVHAPICALTCACVCVCVCVCVCACVWCCRCVCFLLPTPTVPFLVNNTHIYLYLLTKFSVLLAYMTSWRLEVCLCTCRHVCRLFAACSLLPQLICCACSDGHSSNKRDWQSHSSLRNVARNYRAKCIILSWMLAPVLAIQASTSNRISCMHNINCIHIWAYTAQQ